VSSREKDRFWQHLDSMTENNDTLYFSTTLRDAEGNEIEVAVSASTFATRTRTLALLLTRPAKPLAHS
jgi:hypothetical protein